MMELPIEVVRVLDAAARRVRKIFILRGIVVTGTVFVLTSLAAMIADACLVLFDDWARYALAAAVWLPTLVLAALLVVRPWLRPISRRRAAEALDERHPEHEELLTTLVELEQSAKAGKAQSCSEQICTRLAREAAACAAKIDIRREFTSRTVVRRLRWLALALGLLVASFAVFPNFSGLLFVRVTLPWLDLGSVFSDWIAVTPGSVVVLKGTTVEIKAQRLKPQLKDEMTIRISRRVGNGWGAEFAEPLPDEGYRELADMTQSFWRYRISCGPAVSRYYTVRVCEPPRYKSFVARLDYPDYVQRPPVAYTNEQVGTIQAIAGTRVTFDLAVDGAGTTGELRLEGKDGIQISDDGRLAATTVSNNVSTWSMQITSAEGFKSPKRSGPFVSILDQPPTVVIESPTKTLQLPPHAKLPIVYTASDDIGLAEVEVLRRGEDEPWRHDRLATFAPRKPLVRATEEIDLSRYEFANARDIRFAVVVRDAYPAELGGPHAVTSSPVIVSLRTDAKTYGEQSAEDAYRYASEAMREAERRLESAERLAREGQNNVAREKDKTSDRTEMRIAELAHEVAEAEKRAGEQAERLEEIDGLKTVADELKAFAEDELAPVRAKLEEAQFASPEKRVAALERMQPMLREARARMAEAEKELRERVNRVKNYEKARDLAERQEALAKAAEKLTQTDADEKNLPQKIDAWKRMEDAAARLADELNRAVASPDVEEARRKMALAAQKMEQFKRAVELENNTHMKPEQKEKVQADRAAARERERQRALGEAEKQSKRAEEFIAKALERAETAAKEANPEQRANRVREAENFERTALSAQKEALSNLERGEAKAEVVSAEERAAEEVRRAGEAAFDRVSELKAALVDQKEVTQGLKGKQTNNRMEDSAARHSAMRQALEKLREAEAEAENALDALRRHDGEAAEKVQSAEAEAMKSARAAYAANALDAAERTAAKAREATANARHRQNHEWSWNQAVERQEEAVRDVRKAADALAEELGASPAEIAKMRRAEKLDDRRRAAEATADLKSAQSAAALVRGDKGGAERFAREAAAAADRAEGLAQVSSPDAVSESALNGDAGDNGEAGNPAPSGDAGSSSSRFAAEAADALESAAAALAKKLDINAAAPGARKSQGTSSVGGTSQGEQVERMIEDSVAIPESLRGLFSVKSWFRIRGAVREGLGERDLKNVPPEYRDLVRRYFLKLSGIEPKN